MKGQRLDLFKVDVQLKVYGKKEAIVVNESVIMLIGRQYLAKILLITFKNRETTLRPLRKWHCKLKAM